MNKIINKINFAVIGILSSVPAFAAGYRYLDHIEGCASIARLEQLFKICGLFFLFVICFCLFGMIFSKPNRKIYGVLVVVGMVLSVFIRFVISYLIDIEWGMDCLHDLRTF